jgi:hypothetical protein
MSKDMYCIPDDIFAIVGKYLQDDIHSLIALVKTKKSFKEVISSEVNLKEKKQHYIDNKNCLIVYNLVKKIASYESKLDIMLDIRDLDYDTMEYTKKIRLYEDNKDRKTMLLNDVLVAVNNKNCVQIITQYIHNNYKEVINNYKSYNYNILTHMCSQKLYYIILNIDNSFVFNEYISNGSDILNWILELNYYDYDSENDTYIDYNY